MDNNKKIKQEVNIRKYSLLPYEKRDDLKIDEILKNLKDNPENDQLALRYNHGKLQWSLIDYKSLEPLVKALEFGKHKYTTETISGRDNWKKGLPVLDLIDSCMRHLIAFKAGENLAEDSNVEHIGHAMANLMFIQYMIDNKPELDNR